MIIANADHRPVVVVAGGWPLPEEPSLAGLVSGKAQLGRELAQIPEAERARAKANLWQEAAALISITQARQDLASSLSIRVVAK